MSCFLLIPFFLVRFGMLALLNREAVLRAAHFPPLQGAERAAYWVYQGLTVGILVLVLLLRIKTAPPALFYAGAAVYGGGFLLLTGSVVCFAAPSESGMNQRGLYRLSRNPMYAAYFLLFLGCALLTQSLLLLGFVLAFQIAAHWMIRAEERWCEERFGAEYLQYKKKVRRYF